MGVPTDVCVVDAVEQSLQLCSMSAEAGPSLMAAQLAAASSACARGETVPVHRPVTSLDRVSLMVVASAALRDKEIVLRRRRVASSRDSCVWSGNIQASRTRAHTIRSVLVPLCKKNAACNRVVCSILGVPPCIGGCGPYGGATCV